MMTASMCRMNGSWRTTSAVLLLCALLLGHEVMCQDEGPTDAAAAVGDATDAPGATAAPADAAAPTLGAAADDSAASGAAGDVIIALNPEDGAAAAVPTFGSNTGPVEVRTARPALRLAVPDVMCVGKEEVAESNAVKAVMSTSDCEATKRIIMENAAGWCHTENCKLKIFQDGETVLVSSEDAALGAMTEALMSEQLKDKLGVTNAETPSSSSSSSGASVFIGILVSGLLAAIGITVGYCKCQRRADPKGARLAEEAFPVDQENQGNTLVSVAPLSPPAETQEKPSVNGESPEAAKTPAPPPPTNGTPAAKTADTEL